MLKVCTLHGNENTTKNRTEKHIIIIYPVNITVQ